MKDNDEYDPDRALWVCGRRSFLFLTGMTAIGAALGIAPGGEAVLGLDAAIGESWTAMVEVIPLATPQSWRPELAAGVTAAGATVMASQVRSHGLTEVLRGHWHLSEDGEIMWRRTGGLAEGGSRAPKTC